MENETPEEIAKSWFAIIAGDHVIFTSGDMKNAFLSGWQNAVERLKGVWDDGYEAGRKSVEAASVDGE